MYDRYWIGACVLVAVLTARSALGDGGTERPDHRDSDALIAEINRVRASENLPPVVRNEKLESASKAHARDMAGQKALSHKGSDGATLLQRLDRERYAFQNSGENVSRGQTDAAAVIQRWMESPPHKAVLLGDFKEAGGGRGESDDGTWFWCVDFGLPWPKLEPERAEQELIERINEERTRARRSPVKLSPKLGRAARLQAEAMAAVDRTKGLDTEGPDPFQRVRDAGYRFANVAAMGVSGEASAGDALASWLEDVDERSNLADAVFKEVGTGYATTDNGVPYWFVILAKPKP